MLRILATNAELRRFLRRANSLLIQITIRLYPLIRITIPLNPLYCQTRLSVQEDRPKAQMTDSLNKDRSPSLFLQIFTLSALRFLL